MSKHLLCILSIIMATIMLIGCGGGGGGSKGGNDLSKLISTASKTVSGDTNTEIGDLSTNGISLNLAKNSVEAGGKVTINQYSNIAAAARLSQQYPALASFTAISSLYDMSATDKNGKKVSTLNNPSELSIAVSEDISSEKLYFAAIKQNDNWDLTPLSTSANASYRAAVSQSKTVKITLNTVFDSLFIVVVPKANIPSKLTYAEAFYFSVNGSTTTPQTIAASYIQKFDNDIEVNIRLTLKGELTPDKADMTLTAIQNGNKTIGIRKTDKSYKDMTFTSTDETGKYKGSVKLDSSLATISMAGDTATYTFYIKAKDIAVSDMPSTLILRASIAGSKPFYSSDMQINFAKGPDRVANNVKMTIPSTTSDVTTNTTVILNFDQPVKIDSGKEAVLIPVTTDGNTVKADYSFSNSNKTLTIKFSENLAFNTKYTVSIKSGIQSENIKYKDVTPIDFVFTTGARRYTITFDGNGNTSGSVPMEKDSFLSKATYTLPTTTDLVKTGFLFNCWNTKADGTGTDYALGSAITFATSDIVLYAKWDKTYTITFDGNGHTEGIMPQYDNIDEAEPLIMPTDIGKNHYLLESWNTKPDGTGIIVTDYMTPGFIANELGIKIDTITLYAIWKKIPVCNIVYDGNGSTSGSVPIDNNFYEMKNTITYCDGGVYTTYYPAYTSLSEESVNKVITVASVGNMTKEGYVFSHWNTKADDTGDNINPGDLLTVSDYEYVIFGGAPTIIDDNNPIIIGDSGVDKDKTVTLYAQWVICEFAGGMGTIENPYLVETAEQLNKVRNYPDKHFKQIADIDLGAWLDSRKDISRYPSDEDSNSNAGWLPIADFRGTYNGDYKKINNVFINRPDDNYVGLFSNSKDGELRNIIIKIADNGIIGNDYVGSLAGYADSISHCCCDGKVEGHQFVGCLAGQVASIQCCYAIGSLTANGIAGGLIGWANSSISNCTAYVIVSVGSHAGGIVGTPIGRCEKTFACGSITGSSSVGGIIAYSGCSNNYSNIAMNKFVTNNVISARVIGQIDVANSTCDKLYAWNGLDNDDIISTQPTWTGGKTKTGQSGADVSKSEFWGASTKNSFWIDKLGWTDFDENWEFRSGYNLPQLKGLPSIADPDYLTNAE